VAMWHFDRAITKISEVNDCLSRSWSSGKGKSREIRTSEVKLQHYIDCNIYVRGIIFLHLFFKLVIKFVRFTCRFYGSNN
jgi:hypothetical protein